MKPGEYAEHRKVSPAAISGAIKNGKIFKTKDGLIDREQADSMYTPQYQTPLQGRRPRDMARAADAHDEFGVISDDEDMETDDPGQDDGEPPRAVSKQDIDRINALLGEGSDGKIRGNTEDIFVKARAAREVMKMKTEEIKLEELRGSVISREDVVRQVARISKHNRDAWMHWPDDAAVAMAAEIGCEAKLLRDVLHRAVVRRLEDIANLSFDDVHGTV